MEPQVSQDQMADCPLSAQPKKRWYAKDSRRPGAAGEVVRFTLGQDSAEFVITSVGEPCPCCGAVRRLTAVVVWGATAVSAQSCAWCGYTVDALLTRLDADELVADGPVPYWPVP